MDVLSEVLSIIKMRGSLYFRTQFTPPWGVLVPAYRNVARFHLASRGQCWVVVGKHGKPFVLANGDLLVIPHGAEHRLSDSPDTQTFSVDEILAQTGFGGEGALIYGGEDGDSPTSLVCGHFEFDEDATHPLLEALPAYIHISASDTLNHVWLEGAMKFIGHEAGTGKAGSDAIVNKLSEVLFIQAVRAYVQTVGSEAKCLAGLLDPQIGRALRIVHRAPEAPWTVESMAREAHLSRTGFAQRFGELMGLTPFQYVTHLRMQKARELLVDSNHSVLSVAERAGYRSEAAFNRAFKTYFKLGPGAYRRQKRSRSETA